MKVLFLEPFFAGSHKDFATGLKAHSRHEITLETLPARFWKWRMRGAALHFIDQIKDLGKYDAIIASSMMDLTDFKALANTHLPPILLYFHENQLSYPLSPNEKRDSHLGFTNIISAFCADKVIFNSEFHLNDFIKAMKPAINQMPDYEPKWMIEKIKKKSEVIYPGCWFAETLDNEALDTDSSPVSSQKKKQSSPTIIWNHRWEHDKNPEFFFDMLAEVKSRGVNFTLALLGENYKMYPKVFDEAKNKFKNEILVFGRVESRQEYYSWLKKGSIVFSSSNQENFGISVVEAIRYGCLPLLPSRLSYPELIPKTFHSTCLYKNREECIEKMIKLLSMKNSDVDNNQLSKHMSKFSWKQIIDQYDKTIDDLKS